MTMKTILSILILSLNLLGCAPTAPSNLFLPRLSVDAEPSSLTVYQTLDGLNVDKFIDSRPQKAICDYDGSLIDAGFDIGLRIQDVYVDYFRKQGLKQNKGRPGTIKGDVLEWFAVYKHSFPLSEVDSTALIQIEYFDPQGNLAYTGKYSGGANERKPLLNQDDVKNSLMLAMRDAIAESIKDFEILSVKPRKR